MNSGKNLKGLSDLFYNLTFDFLDILKKYWTNCGYTTLLVERTPDICIDTLVVNFGTNSNPLNLTFTFIPIPDENIGIDTVFLQIYTILSSKPQVTTMSELEKTLNFLNNKLPIGSFGISNSNKIILKSVQGISTVNKGVDVNLLNKIVELFEMIVSIFTTHISDICNKKKTFKQIAFELSN